MAQGEPRPQPQGRAARAALMSDGKNVVVKLKKSKDSEKKKKETELDTGLPAAIGAVFICRNCKPKHRADVVEDGVRHDVAEVGHPAGAAMRRSVPEVALAWELD